MSRHRGNPFNARHPIRGLITGDRIAWIVLDHASQGDPVSLGAVIRRVTQKAGNDTVLLIAIPPERRQAVIESLKSATEWKEGAAQDKRQSSNS